MGTFLFITSVQVPSSAAAGAIVDVEVTVGNPGPSVFTYAAVTGVYNGTEFSFSPSYHELPPDASKLFTGQFVMPSKDASISVYAFYWASDKWNPDDQKTVIVELGEGPLDGRITRKYLKHDGSALQDIPAGDIPLDDSTQIHMYCEHDSPTTKKLTAEWVVYDPDGYIADRYGPDSDNVSANHEKHFYDYSGPKLSKPGRWTIVMKLWVEDELVDNYGTDSNPALLCTVPGGEIGDGEIISRILLHGTTAFLGEQTGIPASGIEVGEYFKLKIGFRNTCASPMNFGLHWVIRKPNDDKIEDTATELIGTNPDAIETFTEPLIYPYRVDMEGIWKLEKLELLGEEGDVLDSWSGNLLTAVGSVEGNGEIISKAILHGKGLVPTETASIPASNIEKGERFKLKIGVKNTGAISMKFGLHWVIRKPGGNIVEATATELISTPAGATETFLEPTAIPYLIDEEGTWRLEKLELLAEGGGVLDSWSGVLLTAVEVPVDGDGDIGELSRVWINWSSYTYLIPPAIVQNKGTFEVYGEARNISSIDRKFGVKVTAIKPISGAIVSPDIDYEAGWTGAGGTQPFGFNMGLVDELGVWTGTVELYEYEGELLDSWGGELFTVGEAEGDLFSAIPALIGVVMMMMILPMMGDM